MNVIIIFVIFHSAWTVPWSGKVVFFSSFFVVFRSKIVSFMCLSYKCVGKFVWAFTSFVSNHNKTGLGGSENQQWDCHSIDLESLMSSIKNKIGLPFLCVPALLLISWPTVAWFCNSNPWSVLCPILLVIFWSDISSLVNGPLSDCVNLFLYCIHCNWSLVIYCGCLVALHVSLA